MRYQDLNSRLLEHINTLRAVIAALMLMLLLLGYAWHAARSDIRIHIPPDLRSGAVVKADDIAPAHVYGFAAYIFQQLNHWNSDGETDYGQQIFRMAAYLVSERKLDFFRIVLGH